MLSLLAACAGNQAYNDGQAMLGEGHTQQGLALLEQAAQAEPTNAKYRIAVTNGRMRALNNLNGRAEALRQQGKLPEAQALYQQAAKAAAPASGVDANAPPPLPFQFLGRFVDEGKAAYFLQAGERNVVARPGDTLEERYRFDGVVQGALQFTYLPLNLKQTLAVGDLN